MKLLKSVLSVVILTLLSTLPVSLYSQSGPPAPSNGIWAIIDTNYTVGTTNQGQTVALITLQNTTTTLTTGTQFRVFYDNTAFTSCSVNLVGSSSNLYLQYVDNNAQGYITITLVYTGNSSTFSLSNGETFQLTFEHVESSIFTNITSINNLSWTTLIPTNNYTSYVATQPGFDLPLSLHNYGGNFLLHTLNFSGTFTNVTGSGAKNLSVALEKKPKTGSVWSIHDTYTTNVDGYFSFNESIDTTFFDVRISVQGDTMNVGNVISTADAELINQWVLGTSNPSGFDFYSADVNSSNNVTISDAYGVFGRIAGRFTTWPNSTSDIKFFTQTEFNTITTNPTNNYTSSISGVTNFVYNILPGQPSSVQFYVLVPGDANGTGFHMARLTPINVEVNHPEYPSATENVIDLRVQYDFPTSDIEINMPSLTVSEGNLVEVPVKVLTNDEQVSSLQLAVMYNPEILEFKDILNSEKTMMWLTFLNTKDNTIEWGGYDPTAELEYLVNNDDQIFTLRFLAKQPQSDWDFSPLFTTRKFSGNEFSKDLNINPSNGVVVVTKVAGQNDQVFQVYPNPTTGEITLEFEVKNAGAVLIYISDPNGVTNQMIINQDMPAGKYIYQDNISNFSSGLYFANMKANSQSQTCKIIKK